MFEQTFKNIDDILHKDAGCTSELDYTEQSSWPSAARCEEPEDMSPLLTIFQPGTPRRTEARIAQEFTWPRATC